MKKFLKTLGKALATSADSMDEGEEKIAATLLETRDDEGFRHMLVEKSIHYLDEENGNVYGPKGDAVGTVDAYDFDKSEDDDTEDDDAEEKAMAKAKKKKMKKGKKAKKAYAKDEDGDDDDEDDDTTYSKASAKKAIAVMKPVGTKVKRLRYMRKGDDVQKATEFITEIVEEVVGGIVKEHVDSEISKAIETIEDNFAKAAEEDVAEATAPAAAPAAAAPAAAAPARTVRGKVPATVQKSEPANDVDSIEARMENMQKSHNDGMAALQEQLGKVLNSPKDFQGEMEKSEQPKQKYNKNQLLRKAMVAFNQGDIEHRDMVAIERGIHNGRVNRQLLEAIGVEGA